MTTQTICDGCHLPISTAATEHPEAYYQVESVFFGSYAHTADYSPDFTTISHLHAKPRCRLLHAFREAQRNSGNLEPQAEVDLRNMITTVTGWPT